MFTTQQFANSVLPSSHQDSVNVAQF